MDHDRFDREARERATSMSLEISTALIQGWTSAYFTLCEALVADLFRYNPWLTTYYRGEK